MINIIRKNKKYIMIAGLLSIVAGYLFLAQGSESLAPVLLVMGYCVLVPVALL
ncbi:MAG: hypothetical protein R6U43_08020 [Candidatus Krumholzibacteriales bacterium]